MSGEDDPGWRPALRPIWKFLVPWVAFSLSVRHVGATPHDPADLSSAEKVANGFRALSFIRLGLVASPALYGIVGTQLTETAELGFVGAAFSVVLIALYGPTRSRVDDIQDRLRAAGSPISLRAALVETAS